jgi:biopolymer transport protein ExbD
MLAHELAHLERRDPAWLFAAHVVEALFCVQPLVRWVRRRMQDDMEYLCDAWAAERTARPVPLARCLATVAGWLEGERTPALAPGMATTDSRLVQRVEALLGGGRPRGRGAARVATVATGLALVALACVGPHAEEGDAGDERGHVLAMQEDGSVLVDGRERVGLDAVGAWLSALDEREAARVLTIEAAEGARYEDVRRLVDLCREARFDALRLEPYGAAIVESDGASGRIHARIVEHEADDGSEELLVVLAITGPGQRVNPDGTPWSGQGKFRYDETRKLRYTVDGLILDSLRDVEQRLAAKRRAAPDRKVLIDAQAGVVYRDVVDVLDGVVRAGFTHISFVGAYDDADDDEPVPLDAEPEERGARDRRALDTEVERLAGALEQGRAGLLTSAGPDGDTRHWLMLLEDGDLRGLAEYDAQDDAGHWRRVQAALRDAAAGMPRAAAQTMPPLELARDRLTIHADPGAPFMHVQRIMELCGSMDVQIWKVELQRGGGAQAPVIPVFLPLDAGVLHAENDLSDGPGERVEVVLRELDGGAMQYTIGSWRSRDLLATCERLTMLLARERRATGADARPLIDVCDGVNAGTVLDLLERLQADGQESFSFVGYRKER